MVLQADVRKASTRQPTQAALEYSTPQSALSQNVTPADIPALIEGLETYEAAETKLDAKTDTRSSPPAGKASAARGSAQLPPREDPGEDPEIDSNESVNLTIIWRGTLNMNRTGEIPAVARPINGADLSLVLGNQTPLSVLLPQHLQVIGRANQDKADDYLCSLRSDHKDLIVLALFPNGENATMGFTALFDYFHKKNCYAVVHAEVSHIIYLIPLPAGPGNVPKFLSSLDNNNLLENRLEPLVLVALS